MATTRLLNYMRKNIEKQTESEMCLKNFKEYVGLEQEALHNVFKGN